MILFLRSAILASVLLFGTTALTSAEPAFEDYPVKIAKKNPRLKPQLERGGDFWEFRTRIREGATEPINFAGRYIYTYWGCGTECQYGVIIDAVTGDLYEGVVSGLGVDIRPDSNLLVVNPPEAGYEMPGYLCTEYYVFDGSNLLKISKDDCEE